MKTKKRIMDMEKDRLGATIQYLKYGEVTLQNFGFQRYEKLKAEEIKQVWDEHGEQIINDWVQGRPGSRPEGWWDFDAPEFRLRLGGVGDPAFEVQAYDPGYVRGLPNYFVNIDWDAPPVYESQAAFLKRLGLMFPGEAERIPAAAYDPIKITDEYL